MIKNNLKSLGIHITISIISMIVFFLFSMGQPKWASEEAARSHHNSMMFLAILGVLLWAIAFNIDSIGPSNQLLNSEFWQHYCTFNGYCLFLLEESGINNLYVFLVFSFIPTIAMWTGIEAKR